MTWWMRNCLRYAWLILIIFGLITAAAIHKLPNLKISISPEALVLDDDPATFFYREIKDTFGDDGATIVFLRDADLFEPHNIGAIKSTIRRLDRLAFVLRTESLFSVPRIDVIGDSVSTEPYFSGDVPDNTEQCLEIAKEALRNPLIRHNLLSDRLDALAINVYLKPDSSGPAFSGQIVAAIEEAIAPLHGELAEVFQIGLPYIREEVEKRIEYEQFRLFPLSVAVLLLALLVMLRSSAGLVVPLITAGMSIVWLLGGMATLGISLNVMTAIVPVLLLIIGSTEDIHLISEYLKGNNAGYGKQRSMIFMMRHMGLAVLLTFTTTYIGFLGIATNSVPLLREFGLIASSGIALNFLITVTLVPIYLQYFGPAAIEPRERQEKLIAQGHDRRYTPVARMLGDFVIRRRKIILLAALLFTLLFAFGATKIQINNSLISYFDPEDPVRQRTAAISASLSGIETASIIIDAHIEETFQKVRYLKVLQKLQRFIENHPRLDSSLSVADYLALAYSAVNDSGAVELPEEDDVAAELMLFLSRDEIKHYISEDLSLAHILVRHNLTSSVDLATAIAELQDFIDRHVDPRVAVQITGESILSNHAADYIAKGQPIALSIVLATIVLIIGLLFTNLKAGLLAVLPNMFSIIILFGTMGFLRIPLDTGTAMIAAIALGVGIDHTMHFMVRYYDAVKHTQSLERAIYRTVAKELLPISAASVALIAGLLVIAASSFTPLIYFGLLSAMVMFVAIIANFLITPALLSFVRLATLWELMSVSLRRELMHSCSLFEDMRFVQIRRTVLMGQLCNYLPGEIIIRRDAAVTTLYILLEGHIAVLSGSNTSDRDTQVHLNTPGAVFGMTRLLGGVTPARSVIVLNETKILCLDWAHLEKISRHYPSTGYRLFRNLARLTCRNHDVI